MSISFSVVGVEITYSEARIVEAALVICSFSRLRSCFGLFRSCWSYFAFEENIGREIVAARLTAQ